MQIINSYNIQVQLLHPLSKLQWKRCADMPVEMSVAKAVAIGDQVYVGGVDKFIVLEYNTVKDKWTCLPEHCVGLFGLCQFQGELLTVGGGASGGGSASNKVYHYSTADRKWVESLKPMATVRVCPAVLTTASAIIVCGGLKEVLENNFPVPMATVEVYSSTTSQWHTADPLPQPCYFMSSVVISGSGYLLGGNGTRHDFITSVFSVDMATLIDRATSPTTDQNTTSTWKTLPDTPLGGSTAATLSGRLLALGGSTEDNIAQSAVYVFIPSTNSWVPSGNLPVERFWAAAAQLSSNQLILPGGLGKYNTSTCYIGTEDVAI